MLGAPRLAGAGEEIGTASTAVIGGHVLDAYTEGERLSHGVFQEIDGDVRHLPTDAIDRTMAVTRNAVTEHLGAAKLLRIRVVSPGTPRS